MMSSELAASPPDRHSGPAQPQQVISDKYQLLRAMSSGGVASIWLAHNRALGNQVAIKLLHERMTSVEQQRRLIQEAQLVARIEHSNVVRVLDLGFTDWKAPYVVMELLEGRDLGAELDDCGRLPPVRAVQLLLGRHASCSGSSVPHVNLTVFGRTDPGRVRKNNEDAFVVADLGTPERDHSMASVKSFDVGTWGVLVAVSDGMGGAQAGEVASTLALRALRIGLGAGSANGAGAALQASVEHANKDVWNFARASHKDGMGATLTAMLVHDRYAYIAEIGDSRAYLLRGGRFAQLTRDQSYVQQLVDQGALTREQAATSDYKNVILQAVGLKPEVTVAMSRVQLRRGDRFLLCSDGLSNMLPDADMQAMLARGPLDAACATLVDTANARGGTDNITAVLIDVGGDVPVATAGERITVDALQARSPQAHIVLDRTCARGRARQRR